MGAASEEEEYCRCVIAWAHTEAPPEWADELTNRLQVELDALLRAGTLRLPDAKAGASGSDSPTPPVALLPQTAPAPSPPSAVR